MVSALILLRWYVLEKHFNLLLTKASHLSEKEKLTYLIKLFIAKDWSLRQAILGVSNGSMPV